jgi:hypothetical protein
LYHLWRRAKIKLHRRLTRWLLRGIGPYEKLDLSPFMSSRTRYRHRIRGKMRFNNRLPVNKKWLAFRMHS